MSYLGVVPGAVTPFALINDRGGQVKVAIDKTVLDHDPVNCHPLANDMTTAICAHGSPGLHREQRPQAEL